MSLAQLQQWHNKYCPLAFVRLVTSCDPYVGYWTVDFIYNEEVDTHYFIISEFGIKKLLNKEIPDNKDPFIESIKFNKEDIIFEVRSETDADSQIIYLPFKSLEKIYKEVKEIKLTKMLLGD